SLALLNRGQLDPLEERGRNVTALAGTLDCKQAGVGGTRLVLEFSQVRQAALAAEVGGGVADELDAKGPAFFEVLLDPGVAVEEGLDLLGAEAVADGLKAGRVAAGGEAVGELAEGEAFGAGLTLGPFVAIEPDLARVREVGAELDEPGAELLIPQVEVVGGHPTIGLLEAEVDGAGLGGAVMADHDGLELLGNPDGDNAGSSGGL